MPSEKRKSKYYGDSERIVWPADHPGRPGRPKSKRKDTRRWCRGKVGVEHVLVVQRASWARERPCRESKGWRREHWICWHERACTNCGKILEHTIKPSECPDRPTS